MLLVRKEHGHAAERGNTGYYFGNLAAERANVFAAQQSRGNFGKALQLLVQYALALTHGFGGNLLVFKQYEDHAEREDVLGNVPEFTEFADALFETGREGRNGEYCGPSREAEEGCNRARTDPAIHPHEHHGRKQEHPGKSQGYGQLNVPSERHDDGIETADGERCVESEDRRSRLPPSCGEEADRAEIHDGGRQSREPSYAGARCCDAT